MLKPNWSYRVESQRYMVTIVFVIFVVIRLRNYYAFLHSQEQKNWQNLAESMILYSANSTIA